MRYFFLKEAEKQTMIDKLSGFSALPPSFQLPDFSSMERGMSERIERFEKFFDSPEAVVSQLARTFTHQDTTPYSEQKPETKPLTPSTSPAEATSIKDLKQLAQKSADQYGVNASLVKSVINAESGFDPNAVSKAGAEGLMQLMPGTAKDLGVNDPFNPAQNVDGGVRYLKSMLNRYSNNVPLALAAYNAGPGAVDKAQGIPDFPETQDYVQKVMSNLGNFSGDLER